MTPRKVPRALAVVALALLVRAGAAGDVPAAADAPQLGPAPTPPPFPTPPPSPSEFSALDELVAPIALYPDPLVALILPASTAPEDIAAAQAYLVQYGDVTQIDRQPWDPSVRGLAHYPAIIEWMMDNAAWTQALGEAFLASPPNVMQAIQRLRARALAEGVLFSTPQQRVYSDNGQIEILPSQPDSIFIPGYDADSVFAANGDASFGGPPITYGSACDVGPWLSYGIDWDAGGLWSGGWDAWHSPGGWYRPHYDGRQGPPNVQPWHPKRRNVMPLPTERGTRSLPVPHPHPMQGAPTAAAAPARTGTIELAHPGEADPRFGAPLPGRPEREGAPTSARAQAAAPATHPAPQPAPAPARDAPQTTPTGQDPRSR